MNFLRRSDELKTVAMVCCVCAGVMGVQFMGYLTLLKRRRQLAYQGDIKAASRVFLPCYYPLFRALAAYYLLFAGLCFGLNYVAIDSVQERYALVGLYLFQGMATASVGPVLLMQPAVSMTAFYNTAKIILP